MTSHTVITTYCSEEKKTLETFNDISQLIVHCAVMPSAAKLSVAQLDYRLYAAKVSAVQLDHLQLEANKIGRGLDSYEKMGVARAWQVTS